MELKVYNNKAEEVKTLKIDEAVFSTPWNSDLVHQVIVSMQSNARTNTTQVKDRSAVSGGGKKPWRQKGTGRARHGSRRSPIWVGGGVTHGPTNEKNYSKKINKKMKSKALAVVVSAKVKDNELILLNSSFDGKTKNAVSVIKSLANKPEFEKINRLRGRRALIVTPEKDESVIKSFSNIKTTKVEEVRNINPLLVATYKYIVLTDPEKTIEILTSRLK